MRRNAIAAIGFVVACLINLSQAPAGDLKILTTDFAPLTSSTGAKKGFLHDVVQELLKIQKSDQPIQFMDWTEAQDIAQKEPNVLLFPMTRTPKREGQYIWVVKIFDMDRPFCSRPGSTPINTIEEAGKLKAVGAATKTASLTYLKDKGLTNIVEFATSLEMMQALQAKEIDAAYQPKPLCIGDWKAAGGQGGLVFGEPQERSAAYIAASLNSTIKPEDWRDAFQVLEQEGRFEQLLEEYGLKE